MSIDQMEADAVAQLEALATAMKLRGFGTAVTTNGGRNPRVTVINKDQADMSEDIYIAPASDSTWWFWWSWAERIVPVDHVDDAVRRITYVLSPNESLS